MRITFIVISSPPARAAVLSLRKVLVAGLAWVTVYTFFPWKAASAKPAGR
jgi:hypothetical protein